MKLIMLKGMGVQGKSHIVNKLKELHPDWIHLPQTNREYYKLMGNKPVGHRGIFDYYKDMMSKIEWQEGATYIAERSFIDYLIYYEYMNNFEKDPKEELIDSTNWYDYVVDCEKEFLARFSKVDIYEIYNEDLDWLKDYFSRIPRNHVHKKCYTSRGVFISLQDRWNRAWTAHKNNLYRLPSVSVYGVKMKKFFEDNDNLLRELIKKYE